jgi:hypothetical protein
MNANKTPQEDHVLCTRVGSGLYEMKVDSENMVPSSVISSSPSFSFNESFSWGEYCVEC